VIAQIANIFGTRSISLTSVIQKEDVHNLNGDRHAEIVFMTHQAHEASVQKALEEIRQLEVVDQIGSVIRVED
jgi:homoserine dehydrogenase